MKASLENDKVYGNRQKNLVDRSDHNWRKNKFKIDFALPIKAEWEN
jgi:hypothetical protein